MALLTLQELHDEVVPCKIDAVLRKYRDQPLTTDTLENAVKDAAEETFKLTMMMIELVYRLDQLTVPMPQRRRTVRL